MAVNLSKVGDTWYSIHDITYAPPLDEWDNPVGVGRTDYTVRKYEVVKVTKCGVWVTMQPFGGDDRRFILLSATKRLAQPTLEAAVTSFKARKDRQISILNAQINRAEVARLLVVSDFASGKLAKRAGPFKLHPYFTGGF